MTDVRRQEVAFGIGLDEGLLGKGWQRAPEGKPIVMMVIRGRDELATLHKPRGLTVAQLLADAVERRADAPQPLDLIPAPQIA